jgi:uncharacterized pyridoxal phosphate-containing UPF0001 family protein
LGIKESIAEIREDILKYSPYPEKVKIVAATKYTDENGIREVAKAGLECIGENRVQAMVEKIEKMSSEELKNIKNQLKMKLFLIIL